MGRTGWVLLGLAAGVVVGLGLREFGSDGLVSAAAALRPLGQLWLNALRMTLVPLVFCLMAGGVGTVTRAAAAGRLVGLTIGLFAVMLTAAATLGAVLALALLALWPVAPVGQALLHAGAAAPATPSIVDQLIGFIPVNPVAAAAEAAMTPLIVFAAIFGAATARIAPESSQAVFSVLKGVADAMLVIVGWVLWAAPAGVFLLALDAVLHVGLGLAASLAEYVLMLCLVLAAGLVCAILAGILGGGIAPARFLRAAFAPQALAASTTSSMACLPALLKAAQDDLGLPPTLVAAVMPLAVTTFRFGNVVGGLAAGLIGAHLCGVHPGPGHIALAIGVGVLTNVGVMGLPGQAVLFAAYGPIFAALGAPFEMLTLLIAVFTLPDILDTTCNVTADLSVTAIVARLSRGAARPEADAA